MSYSDGSSVSMRGKRVNQSSCVTFRRQGDLRIRPRRACLRRLATHRGSLRTTARRNYVVVFATLDRHADGAIIEVHESPHGLPEAPEFSERQIAHPASYLLVVGRRRVDQPGRRDDCRGRRRDPAGRLVRLGGRAARLNDPPRVPARRVRTGGRPGRRTRLRSPGRRQAPMLSHSRRHTTYVCTENTEKQQPPIRWTNPIRSAINRDVTSCQ